MTLVFSLSNIFHSIERRLVYYWIQKIVCIRTTLYDWSSIAIFVKFRSFAFPFDRMWKKERSEKHGKAVKGADCESTSLTTRRPCPLCVDTETDGQKDRSKAFDSTDGWQMTVEFESIWRTRRRRKKKEKSHHDPYGEGERIEWKFQYLRPIGWEIGENFAPARRYPSIPSELNFMLWQEWQPINWDLIDDLQRLVITGTANVCPWKF